MAATAHWNAPADFPVHGSPRDKLGFAVKVATFASAARQPQPWQFQVSDQFVELSAREHRTGDDPDVAEREAMIHCGTALQYLKLALQRHGCFGRVDLFPDLDQPTLAARIHTGRNGARDNHERQLFDALEVGETSPARLELPVADATLDWLSRTMIGDRGWLEFARSETSRQRLLELAKASDRVRLKEIRFQNETLVRAPDGAWESAGFTGTTLHDRFSRWRKPALAVKVRPPTLPPPGSPAVSEPASAPGTFAVLKTKTDDKHGWLAAGQMLARLLLHARVLGLSCKPFLDVLQQPQLRTELRTTIGHKGFTQVILRFAAAQVESHLPPGAIYSGTATASSV